MEAPAQAWRECQIHHDRHLQQVCTTCKKVICTDCQRSGHYNHPVLDIQTYVRQLREQSAEKTDELEQKSNEVKTWRRKHAQLRKDFDRSVMHTKEEIRARGQLIIQWVNKHVEKKIAYVDYFAAENYRRELTRNIGEGDRRLNALKERQAELGRIAGQELSDTQVALMTTAASEEEECRRASLMYTSLPEAPVHRSHVYLPDMDLVDWRRGLRDFMGLPRMAQTEPRLSRKSHLAVAHHVTCSTDPDAEVLGLHVLTDGRLCVAVVCREPQTTSGSAVRLKILDVTGKNVLHDSVLPFLTKKVRFAEAASGHKLIVASAFTMETQVIDLDSSGGPCPRTSEGKLFTFQRKAPSEDSGIFNRIRRRASQPKMEYFKVYEVGLEEQKAVFSVHGEDVQSLAMDSLGRHLAIIQIEKVLDSADFHFSEMPSVVVYERPPEHHHHHHHQHHHAKEVEPKFEAMRTERKNFFPSDLCFYKYRLTREVLVVADLANNALYKVDHESVGPVLQLLMAGCPLLDAPTALATDPKGRLVVGCRGGRVLTLVAREDVCERDYKQPRNVGIDYSSDYERADPPHDEGESEVDDDKDDQAEEADSSSQASDKEDEDEEAEKDAQAQRSSRESGYGDSDGGRPSPAHQPERSSDSSCGSGQDVAWRGGPLPRPVVASVTSSILSRSSVSGRSESASSYSEDSAGARKGSMQSQSSIDVFLPSGTQDKAGGSVSPSDSPAVVVVSTSLRHPSHGSAPPAPQHSDCSGGTDDRRSEAGTPAVRSAEPPLPPPRSHHSSSDNSPEQAAVHRPNNLPLSQELPDAGPNAAAKGESSPPPSLDHKEERPSLSPSAATGDNAHTALQSSQSIPPPLPPHGPRFGAGLLGLESRRQEPKEEEEEETTTAALQSPCRSSSSSQSSSSSLESPSSAHVFPPARSAPAASDLASPPAGPPTAHGSAQRPGAPPTKRPPPPKTAPKPVRLSQKL